MTRSRKRAPRASDPLLNNCPACGALKGQGCTTKGRNAKPLVTKATRLVHADRLEGTADA